VTSIPKQGSTFRVDAVFDIATDAEAATGARFWVIDETRAGLADRLQRIAPDLAALTEFVEPNSGAPAVTVVARSEALTTRGPNIMYGEVPSYLTCDDRTRDLRWHCVSRLGPDFTRDDWISAMAVAQFLQHSKDDMGVVIPFRAKRRGLRVLVADDNQSNQKVTGKLLETAGYDVVFAQNGDDALEIMDSGCVNLVVMDVNMPVLNGLDATKHYRMSALDLPHLPIIGLTADATKRMQQRCLDAGMDACITKPVDSGRLLSLLEQFIGKSGAPERADPDLPISPLISASQVSNDPISETRLRELETLGGSEFVHEVLHTLLSDLQILTSDLQRAQGEDDLYRFRDVAHSIRSCAANVGADPLRRQAERLEYLPAQAFVKQGALELRGLVEQATRLRGVISRRLAH
jgi:two-component system sensor histidine kinase RpfC